LSRAWINIDLDAIAANLRTIRGVLGPSPSILAVVKANAYGHGAVLVAHRLAAAGVTGFAVATPDEALELRAAGIRRPITLLGPCPLDRLEELAALKLTLTVGDPELARALTRRSSRASLAVHLKLDTGMGRYGLDAGQAKVALSRLLDVPGLKLCSLMTHLACAENQDAREAQLREFSEIRGWLMEHGAPKAYQVANSAGCLLRDARRDSFVRPGIALYGIDPSGGGFAARGVELRPALSLHSSIQQLRRAPADRPVGYGGRFRPSRDSLLGIVPVGYGDGWDDRLARGSFALVRGRRVPLVGSVMMDALFLDLTDLPEPLEPGEPVVLLGRQGAEEIRAEELAEQAGTIPYTLSCHLGRRLERRSIGAAFSDSEGSH